MKLDQDINVEMIYLTHFAIVTNYGYENHDYILLTDVESTNYRSI